MILQNKTYKFYVGGMHCKSCVTLTEGELQNHALVEKAVANLGTCCVEVTGNFENKTSEEIARELSVSLAPHGYELFVERPKKEIKWSEFKIAVPITILFVALYIFLQKVGLVNLVSTNNVSFGTAFLIGIIASLSTCMAVVGGLVLSMSASFAKEGDRAKPQIYFHLGRLISFFVLGGVIGAIGSAFQLSPFSSFALSLLVGLVMLILGVNLVDIFPWAKKLQPSLPKFFSKKIHNTKNFKHTFAPALVGLATFFLPCGFTQAMQIYTLSTGSFWLGATTMGAFALGTLPVLALLSFSQFSIKKMENSGVFFKTAGLVVILFALMNIINSLVVIGFIPPVFNF